MTTRLAVLATVLTGLLALGVVGPAMGLGTPGAGPAQVSDNRTVGVQMAAFMQSTAADANATVDSGVWRAAVNRSDAPDHAVTQRAAVLDRRMDGIQERIQRLEAQVDNGTIPEVAYTARASALRRQLANLRVAINETETVATRHGVNVTRLQALRSQASNMTGPEVAAAARNITDAGRGPPADRPGPPDDRGPAGDGGPQTDRGNGGPSGDGGPPASPGGGADRPGDSADATPTPSGDGDRPDSPERTPPTDRGQRPTAANTTTAD